MKFTTDINIIFTDEEHAKEYMDTLDQAELVEPEDDFGPSSLNNVIVHLGSPKTITSYPNGQITEATQTDNTVQITCEAEVHPGFEILYFLAARTDFGSGFYFTTTDELDRITTNTDNPNGRNRTVLEFLLESKPV